MGTTHLYVLAAIDLILMKLSFFNATDVAGFPARLAPAVPINSIPSTVVSTVEGLRSNSIPSALSLNDFLALLYMSN
jgi:hypothetical protein